MYHHSTRMDCFRIVTEFNEAEISALVHPEWFEAFPWLLQGTTTRGLAGAAPLDFGLFGGSTSLEEVRARWSKLQQRLGARGVVHSQQVHGAVVCEYEEHSSGISGLDLVDPCDGHVTSTSGLLLAVTSADCVPVFVIDPERRAVGVLHAGWRGAAAGVIESGVEKMTSVFASRAEDLRLHMGPAICGTCYEVGPEVFAALQEPVPDCPTPIDLRHVLAARAVRLGVSSAAVTISAHCTVCTESGLFSHRKGHGERQVGYIGVLD
jgi:YfiH family protein